MGKVMMDIGPESCFASKYVSKDIISIFTDSIIPQLVERIIPTFERLHPGDQMLIMFDNSSGHSAYADDALVASKMNMGLSACIGNSFLNVSPAEVESTGGKQPLMRDGWYDCHVSGQPVRVVQKMYTVQSDGTKVPKGLPLSFVYLPACQANLAPIGAKLVLTERGLFTPGLLHKCKKASDHTASGDCCACTFSFLCHLSITES